MKNKQITMILSSFNKGGAEKMMVHLANGFVENNIRVDLIVLRNRGSYKSQLDSRVNTVILPNLPAIYLYVPILVIKFLLNRPQKLLSTQTHVNIITMFAAIPLFLRKRIVFREANTPSLSMSDKTFKKKITIFFAKAVYPLAKNIIAISGGVKDDMVNYYSLNKENVNVIYSPVINNDILKWKKEDINNNEFESSTFKIISVGHINPQKDYETLIKAFYDVNKTNNYTLFIIGKDNTEYAEKVKNLVKEKNLQDSVKFLGFIENPYSYMFKADLLVLSSAWEGFGNVIVEALACGCNVVATDCPGGPKEILDHGKYGRLTPVGDYKKLAETILSALKNPLEKKFLIKRANEFSQEKSVKNYINHIFINEIQYN